MKKVISLILSAVMIFSALCISASATSGIAYYIDSENGNDSNAGTSEGSAWKTVENIRSLSLNAGDKVLFRRNGIYTVNALSLTCKGTKENPIVISSYGEGNLPLLTTVERCDILDLVDCSYVTVSFLELTAHNGGGIWVNTSTEASTGITLDNLKIHDIQNTLMKSRDHQANPTEARACVVVKCLSYPSPSPYPVNDFTCTDCEMYDCGNGLLMWGAFAADSTSPWADISDNCPKMIYNKNSYVADCYFHDMDAEGMIIGITENALITNCRFINCCQGVGVDENGEALYYTAPVWYWGGLESTVDHCEISGAKNHGDGMACDFDSWTNYCTYQYIYSHDNNAFICNNPYGCGQTGNTVRYCLSVNDNAIRNSFGVRKYEENFSFYNNTLINCPNTIASCNKDAFIANNIFVGSIVSDWYLGSRETGFSGEITNNCFWGMGSPTGSKNSCNLDPLFVGNDATNPESYRLSKNSPLIGKGIGIDDELTEDFFGNPISSLNIGCYAGEGEESKAAFNLVDFITHFLGSALGFVYQRVADFFNSFFD